MAITVYVRAAQRAITTEINLVAGDVDATTQDSVFEKDAQALVEAIMSALPSGTYDRMMRILLHREVMQYQEMGQYGAGDDCFRKAAETLMKAHEIFANRGKADV